MVTTNYWGEPTVSPRELFMNPELSDSFRSGVLRILDRIGLTSVESKQLALKIWNLVHVSSDHDFERQLQEIVIESFDPSILRAILDDRAVELAREVSPHILSGTLLDVGTGDGMVTWNLRDRFEDALLVDVMDYLDPRVKMPFRIYYDGGAIPTDEQYENVLLLNVLHHSDHPLPLLEDAWKHTKRRLVIIESVYGDAARAANNVYPFTLNVRNQFLYTSFFDWFYNRVLHSDVPVPCNFLPPEDWERLFVQKGMRLETKQDLGIDVDIVPLHHYLFILER